MAEQEYDIAIIGAGVTGTALLLMISKYTNISRIALIEKNNGVAEVNSHPRNNSQTLHFGDIETNYSLEHALEVKRAGEIIERYIKQNKEEELGTLFYPISKMVLAVGNNEVALLKTRFEQFKHAYSNLHLLNREEIARIEPKVVEGREEHQPIAALASTGYIVNYKRLAECFLEDALSDPKKEIDVFFSTKVKEIKKQNDYFLIEINRGRETLRARSVCFAAGAYSLTFAQSLGYGKELAVLPVAGSFYFSPPVLNGKVYTIQEEGKPFAAIHGDPDITSLATVTRFGPTAKPVFTMERRRLKTLVDFVRTPLATTSGFGVLLKIISRDPGFAIRNALYDIPVIGKYLYLKSVRKIIPTMKYSDLRFGKGIGGLRPQVVDMRTGELFMGESTIVGDKLIFVTTPSPGATSSMQNGVRFARIFAEFLGTSFNEERFHDFGTKEAMA